MAETFFWNFHTIGTITYIIVPAKDEELTYAEFSLVSGHYDLLFDLISVKKIGSTMEQSPNDSPVKYKAIEERHVINYKIKKVKICSNQNFKKVKIWTRIKHSDRFFSDSKKLANTKEAESKVNIYVKSSEENLEFNLASTTPVTFRWRRKYVAPGYLF